MTDNQKKIGIGAIVAILLGLAFYFLYWVKTPAYSLNIIREAAQKHDVTTFEKHVDLDSIGPKFVDDLIVAQAEISGENILSNPIAAGFIQAMKPSLVSFMKNETLKAVRGEDISKDTVKEKNDKNELGKDVSKKLVKQTNEVKDVSVISKEGNIANVAMKIFDKSVDGEYTVKMKMSQLDDGKWKIKEITNTTEFLVTIDKLYKAKLEKLNKPIREELAKAISCTRAEMSSGSDNNPFFATKWITYKMDYKNNSGKNILHFTTCNKIIDSSQKVLRTKYLNYRDTFQANETLPLKYRDKLNPFIDNETQLLNNLESKTLVSEIDYIKYEDGKEVKVLTEIPIEEAKK